ncbi:hypothetical protein D3C87_1862960 [compost metagenome]
MLFILPLLLTIATLTITIIVTTPILTATITATIRIIIIVCHDYLYSFLEPFFLRFLKYLIAAIPPTTNRATGATPLIFSTITPIFKPSIGLPFLTAEL